MAKNAADLMKHKNICFIYVQYMFHKHSRISMSLKILTETCCNQTAESQGQNPEGSCESWLSMYRTLNKTHCWFHFSNHEGQKVVGRHIQSAKRIKWSTKISIPRGTTLQKWKRNEDFQINKDRKFVAWRPMLQEMLKDILEAKWKNNKWWLASAEEKKSNSKSDRISKSKSQF